MENVVNEFRNIKAETKQHLEATYNNMKAVAQNISFSRDQLGETETSIAHIQEQSETMANIVSIIVDIAERINLLSLNASIEAARAGEYGRGFSVVADEIGKLAFQTSESIKEIESVLSMSSKTTNEGVDIIHSSAEKIMTMIDKMAESTNQITTLQESILIEEKYINLIINQMFENIDLAKNIGLGTDEQKNAISSTTKAIEHVNEVVTKLTDEIVVLATTSKAILNSANELMQKSEEAAEVADDESGDM